MRSDPARNARLDRGWRFTLFVFLIPAFLHAGDEGDRSLGALHRQVNERRWTLSPEIGFQWLQNSQGLNLSGVSLGLQAVFGVFRRFGLSGGISQTQSLGDLKTSLFTRAEIGAVYAISGSLRCATETISIAGFETVRAESQNGCGGFKAGLGVTQYYFSASTSTVSTVGATASLYEEVHLADELGFTFGVRADSAGYLGIRFFTLQAMTGLRWLL